MSLSASDNFHNSSTGRLNADSVCSDSVKISYCDLRKVNAKLIELEYEREINNNYKEIISNDSITIASLNSRLIRIDSDYSRTIRNIKNQRNSLGVISIVSIILLVISIF